MLARLPERLAQAGVPLMERTDVADAEPGIIERFRLARDVVQQPLPLMLLRLGEDEVDLVHGAFATPDGHAQLPLGYRFLAETYLRHWPPMPAELERAIDVIEDELMRVPAPPRGGVLFSSDAVVARLLCRLAPPTADSALLLGADVIELAFENMAAVSLGRPASALDAAKNPTDAAALLLLRELMHHLGVVGIAVQLPT